MKTYYVTQQVYFTFKVEANDEQEAIELASQLDYDSAYESYSYDHDTEVALERESVTCD
jgi:hypothetical protein